MDVNKNINNLYVKFKLFYPVFIGSIVAIALITVVLVSKSKQEIYNQSEKNMRLEVNTIRYMFERERELKLEKVKTNLKVAHELFFRNPISFSDKEIQVEAINQHTLETSMLTIPAMMRNNNLVYKSTDFPEETHQLFGGTTTIFQKTDSGYLRISTNVLNTAG
ncbi:MAG: Cache 3/Cache 2 fusion domain-containing protein, partial [Bacteroidetes bacterium]|nr:Cache 3/Cache 2 fusion domain-containing protein [Bacteroidota bacterium]